MRGSAHSKKTRIQKTRELKQTRSMRGRAHSKQLRTQANTINVRPRAFNTIANSIKQCQCAGARIQRNRERKHTRIHNNRELKQIRSMRGRAHSKKTTQANTSDARARAFKKNANSSKHDRCAGARIQNNFELKQTR